jgi:hypothetical protein
MSASNLKDADDFAAVLDMYSSVVIVQRQRCPPGLKTSDNPSQNIPMGQEFRRHRLLMTYVSTTHFCTLQYILIVYLTRVNTNIAAATEEKQDEIWSRFCALYLPATVDRLLIFLSQPMPLTPKSAKWS